MYKNAIHFFLTKVPIYMCMCLFGCTPQPHIIKKKIVINPYHTSSLNPTLDTDSNVYKPPLTIWIHGTHFLRSHLFTHVFKGKPSLKLASEINKRYKIKTIAKTLNKYNAARFPLDTFYIFCWSGKLNANLREKTAHHLYTDLKKAIAQYQETYNCSPRIQIITHSHGGNVALNLAKIKDPHDTHFAIDTLVLLACPVQMRTMSFIDNPIFRRIYSLYSSLDFIQIIAPQLFKISDNSEKNRFAFPPFSNRYFPQRNHITQVKMKINGSALWHNDFVQPKFLKLLPSIISELETWGPTAPLLYIPSVSTANLQNSQYPAPTLALTHIPDVTHSLSVHTADKRIYT